MATYRTKDGWYFSKINDYQKCPRYYQHKYILATLVAEVKSMDMAFGTAVHLGLQETMLGNSGETAFGAYWESLKEVEMESSRHGWEANKLMGETFLARFDRLHKKKFEPIHIEQEIVTDLGGFTFGGTPDLVAKYDGKVAVIDYKTSGMPYERAAIHCDSQMPGYAALVEKQYKVTPELAVYYVFVKDAKAPRIQVLEMDLTRDKIDATVKNIQSVVAEAKGRSEYPMNTKACLKGKYKCQYWEQCFGKIEGRNTDG